MGAVKVGDCSCIAWMFVGCILVLDRGDQRKLSRLGQIVRITIGITESDHRPGWRHWKDIYWARGTASDWGSLDGIPFSHTILAFRMFLVSSSRLGSSSILFCIAYHFMVVSSFPFWSSSTCLFRRGCFRVVVLLLLLDSFVTAASRSLSFKQQCHG